ncbi:MAG: hypothetical protein L0H70_10045, partial [Xanthomonadales bacterium]|nr:hypothetical protein [Xanthomonadales bacterium]
SAINANHADVARSLIDQAAALDAPAAEVAAARVQLARLAQAKAPLPATAASAAVVAAPVALTAAQHQQVQGLILRAQAAASAGQLLQPPASSAYDLFHSALAIDATNSDAMAGLADLPGRARRLFADALKTHKLPRASALLAAFTHLVPGSSAQAPMQKDLTDAWLRQARERAAAGDTGAARHALSEVQKLAPKDPRVLALQRRLGG